MKAPFVWFGGKRRVADIVWRALGDPDNYVEPFAGSLAVLLERPDWHRGSTETVNDVDRYICNFWRALAADPDAVSHYADWPVNETDLFARHMWLVNEGLAQMQAGLDADPDWYDARIAGWWVWGLNSWIGAGWCAGNGPWCVVDGKAQLTSSPGGQWRALPHLGNAGQGVNRKLPHLGRGRGVNRKRPHLGSAGQGVNRKLPHLGDAGRGVNRQLPHLGNAGRGVNAPGDFTSGGQGQAANAWDQSFCTDGERPLYGYMRALAARLRDVRVCCGDWARVVTDGALCHGSTVGVFLDPPYSAEAGRDNALYSEESLTVAHDCAAWCRANQDNPRYRIVLAGYEGEHDLPGWDVHAYKAGQSYGTAAGGGKNKENRHKERLWFSPSCGFQDERQERLAL